MQKNPSALRQPFRDRGGEYTVLEVGSGEDVNESAGLSRRDVDGVERSSGGLEGEYARHPAGSGGATERNEPEPRRGIDQNVSSLELRVKEDAQSGRDTSVVLCRYRPGPPVVITLRGNQKSRRPIRVTLGALERFHQRGGQCRRVDGGHLKSEKSGCRCATAAPRQMAVREMPRASPADAIRWTHPD